MKNAVKIMKILVQNGAHRLTLCPQAKNGRSERTNISTLFWLLTLGFECQMGKEGISLPIKVYIFSTLENIKTINMDKKMPPASYNLIHVKVWG